MANFTHTMVINHTGGGVSTVKTVTKTADAEDNREITVTDGATDLAVALAVDVSALQSLMMVCDQDVTIETNSGSAPTDTILLKANEPLLWWKNSPHTNPLTADITANIYVTHVSSGSAPKLNISVLQDSTP